MTISLYSKERTRLFDNGLENSKIFLFIPTSGRCFLLICRKRKIETIHLIVPMTLGVVYACKLSQNTLFYFISERRLLTIILLIIPMIMIIITTTERSEFSLLIEPLTLSVCLLVCLGYVSQLLS